MCLGAVLGHSLCTGFAVMGGRYFARRISERSILLVGGCLFCIFSVSVVAEMLLQPLPADIILVKLRLGTGILERVKVLIASNEAGDEARVCTFPALPLATEGSDMTRFTSVIDPARCMPVVESTR